MGQVVIQFQLFSPSLGTIIASSLLACFFPIHSPTSRHPFARNVIHALATPHDPTQPNPLGDTPRDVWDPLAYLGGAARSGHHLYRPRSSIVAAPHQK
jgi:hypothetical protein